ncbi:DUF4082 domain-containing protein [Chlorogloea sp. CCALA 695]|nr:DUF4082 domain-containing protein [Chlorogloea sp. CCALA 695]
MTQIMKRRWFIQLMFVSTATAMLANLAKKTLAQNEVPPQLIYGIRAASGKVLLLSLELTTGQIQDLSGDNPEISLEPNERLSGFTSLQDGTFILATAPTVASIVGSASPSRLLSFSSPQALPALQGLERNSTVESLLGTNDGKLLSIISLNQGTPPFRLAFIDQYTGQVSFIDELSLPPNQRFSNLSQYPDGLIYATNLAREGSIKLVKLDWQQGNLISLVQLSYDNKPWSNDLASLGCSLSNQLYGLGDLTYQGTNSLFGVDASTGVLSLVKPFEVDKITFNHQLTQPTQTIFTTQVPSFPDATDGVPYELGMKFQSAKDGQITAIRYWKAPSETGTHVGKIWSLTDGATWATVTFCNETASGWQQQTLNTPLNIQAHTTYVVTVNINSYYVATQNELTSQVIKGDLSTVADGNNGVYGSPGTFPTNSYLNCNYFCDLAFTAATVSV